MSKSLEQFTESNGNTTKSGLQMLIATNFLRFASQDQKDVKGLLLLLAALSVLNSGSDTNTLNIARRLATSGMSKMVM